MLQYDFEESVGCWVFQARHEMMRVMNEELAAHGITYRQWEVLAWISYSGELTQAKLAENMSIEAPTLVGVLDRMERDGWIVRVPAENDRRKKLVRATERVEPMWATMIACAHRVRERAVQGLSEDQLATLKELLAKIRDNLAVPETAEPDAIQPAAGSTAIR